MISDEELIRRAAAARENAYVPHSHFAVGAALLTQSGRVYVGCNVENASYGLTICAERAAVFRAVCAGEREFAAIAVVTANGVSPCGACRQVLREFSADMRVIIATAGAEDSPPREYTLDQLLPDGFAPHDLR